METKNASSRRQLSLILFFGGALGLIFGVVHLTSFLSSGSGMSLSDAVFNASFGVLELLAGWLVTKGKAIAILSMAAAILASLVYTFLVGRGFNIVTLALGGLFLVWAITLWRRGGLS
jgi:hypothetical protein